MRPPHVIISGGANIYPQEVDDVDNPTASLRDVDADLLGKHPELYPDLTVTQQYGIPYETVMDIQLAVLRERFDTLVHKVPVLAKLAESQGIGAIDDIPGAAPLLFPHSIYKSYPVSLAPSSSRRWTSPSISPGCWEIAWRIWCRSTVWKRRFARPTPTRRRSGSFPTRCARNCAIASPFMVPKGWCRWVMPAASPISVRTTASSRCAACANGS